ncbi:MAG: DUF881 domain-containing protein [Microlunatus sp.]|nr:DUF881 domain-containing protein [Microlunatus sp.]
MLGLTGMWRRFRRALIQARSAGRRRDRQQSRWGTIATTVVCAVAGLLVIVSASTARGIDLRPGRYTDLVSLVQSESRRNAALAAEVTTLRAEVGTLAAAQQDPGSTELITEVARRSAQVGLTPVTGPTLTVTLTDAPASVAGDGVDQDLLIVHQQDIQAVANELWRGGAEAMTIQGQRVIATTGIKCVGNTVVLHGIPYAPPYVISAIGDQARLQAALDRSEYVRLYQQYVDAFRLGYQVSTSDRSSFPGYRGAIDLRYADVLHPDQAGGQQPR